MEKSYPEVERRLFRRCIIEGSAVLIRNENLKEPVVVVDVCPRGAGIYCNRPLGVGEQVEIIISCFFDKVVQKKARVVWCAEINKDFWRIGLDFGLADMVELDNTSNGIQ